MDKNNIVLNYIKEFADLGMSDGFLHGMCYQFAKLLSDRFSPNAEIVYDEIANHFAVQIGTHIYDASGDITNNKIYKFELWDSFKYKDPLHTLRIYRDCIWKLSEDYKGCLTCKNNYFDEILFINMCKAIGKEAEWFNAFSCPYYESCFN